MSRDVLIRLAHGTVPQLPVTTSVLYSLVAKTLNDLDPKTLKALKKYSSEP